MSNLTASPPEAAVEPRAPPLTPGPSSPNLMRGGFLLPMAFGLAVVKWPLLLQAASLPAPKGNSVLLPIAIIAVAPWDCVWKRFVRAGGDGWTRICRHLSAETPIRFTPPGVLAGRVAHSDQ